MNAPGDRPPLVEPARDRPPVVESGTPRSVWEDARDLFVAPAPTFQHARRRPRILPPLLLVVGATSLALVVVLAGLGPPDAMERLLEASGLPGGAMMTVAVAFFSVAAVAVGVPLSALVAGGLLWAWSTVRDGSSSFTVAFVAMLYVRLLEPIQALADALAARWVGRDLDAVSIGPTLWVPPGATSPAAYGALAYVNVFSIWATVLVGVAAVHAMGLSRRDATVFAVAIFALGLAFAVVAAVAGGLQAPSASAPGPTL